MSKFNSLVLSICTHGDALQADALALAQLGQAMSFVEFRNKVARVIGTRYGVKPHTSQLKGWLTFTKDTAPEQKLSAICKLHPGCERNKPEPVAVPAKLRNQIVNEIIGAGLTRAQVNALLKEVRDSIEFA